MNNTGPLGSRYLILKLCAKPLRLTIWQNYLYRNLRIDIFGVFSKGLSMSSTLAIWL